MGQKSGKLSPIKKQYSEQISTVESSLAKHNLYRYPGTARIFSPSKQGAKYKTGLDKDSLYMQHLKKNAIEKYKEELQWIDFAIEKLKEAFGQEIDLSPYSDVWNAYSEKEGIHVTPVKAQNEDIFFDLNDPLHLLNYCWIRVENTIASSLEAYNRGEFPDAQYYIADDDAENKLAFSRKKVVNKAITDFEKMVPDKQRKIARLMGLPITDDTPEYVVYNVMDVALKQSEFKEGVHKGLSTINVFNDFASLVDGRLDVMDLVNQAIQFNIYRIGVGGKITEGGVTIAQSRDELVELLISDAKQMDKLALERRVKEKKGD